MSSLTTDDGRTLAWREAGSGPPLFLHPGGPGCSSRYFGEQPELAAKRTLLLLDPRGTGDSERTRDRWAYDLKDYAADIEAVREHLGLARLDLLGHSHGGFVAMAWAGMHPDRVDRLILASTAARYTDEIRNRRMQRVVAHQGQPYFEDAVAALQDQQAGNYSTDEELAALYERASILFAPPGAELEPVALALRAAGVNADALKHFNTQIVGAMDLRPELGRIEAATLVISGDQDPFGGPTMDEIVRALPNPTAVTIAAADHFVFLEADHRREWSQAILDFLSA